MKAKNKKKIAFIANSVLTFGGEQRVISILANELSKKNDITIITEDPLPPKEKPFFLDETIKLRHYQAFSCSYITKGFRFLFKLPVLKNFRKFSFSWKITHYNRKIINRLINYLNNEQYDILIAVSDFLSVLAGYAKKNGLKAKVIAWEHNSFDAYFRTPNICLWNQDKLFAEASTSFDNCVLLNEIYAKEYKENFNITSNVIYNPRSFISPEKAKLTNKIFLTCCRLKITTKGLDMLIEAFAKFAEKNNDWILQIAGDGQDKKVIEKFIKDKNLEKRIQLLGYRSDIQTLMLNSSIFLLPSRWEGFPMTLTEAYECGVPVIAFDIPAVKPFSSEGGILVAEKFNITDFANKMESLASDYDLRKKLSLEAIEFSNKLSVDNFIKKWEEIL